MTKANLWRRLAAIFYDSLLLIALLIIATAIIIPFNHGKAIASHNFLFTSYLLLITFLFFGWFWTHGGQTLGMMAWRIQLLDYQNKRIKWRQALIRFITVIPSLLFFGLGFFWLLIDKEQMTWYDRCSKTIIVSLPATSSTQQSNQSAR